MKTEIYTNNDTSSLNLSVAASEQRTVIFAQETGVSLQAEIETDAQLDIFLFNFGGSNIAATTNNINVNLVSKNARTNIYGLYLIDKYQKIHNEIEVHHNSPNTYSNQLFKGILDDSAQGKFYGHIFVEKNAQKIEAKQNNRNILISPKAKFETKPFLEIYADDVKCSHGATTGQLDGQALFYMRQRGLSFNAARSLMMAAFASEITAHITSAQTRKKIEELIVARLGGGIVGGGSAVCGEPPCEYKCYNC
ncbi:MAG: SufD family Fe-S cluster assembly protein [Prevotellaceae bacterium]|jgi:Fe-S cluster assembly protein SufD|nr:SufD family Fe-S cluster assembly protein [Prevotellaceae bacterium]